MIFGQIPSFDQILDTLGQLGNEINQLLPAGPQEDREPGTVTDADP